MDRFHQLDAFIAVVEAGGFSAAARRASSTQPVISKAVGALEKRLGVALFNRSTRSVTLTDQGQIYYDRTKPLMDELVGADIEVTSTTLRVSGAIRISTPSTFGRLHVLPLLPELLSIHPGLKIDLVLSDFVRDMVDDRIDLGIRVGPVDLPDAIVRKVGTTPLVCVGSRDYFKQFGIPKTPVDLVNHNCLLYEGFSESANWPFVGANGPFSVTVSGNLSSNSVDTIRSAVFAGIGIGLFSKASLTDELAGPEMMTVLKDYLTETRDVSLVWPKRRFIPVRVRLAAEYFTAGLSQRLT